MLAGLIPSVGTVGDAPDNALAEITIGLYKTECVPETRTRVCTVYKRVPEMRTEVRNVCVKVPCVEERTVMGRSENAHIRLFDEGISREHAQVVREPAPEGAERMNIIPRRGRSDFII